MSTKRGSSRRKGDEFQDLIALRTILELYIRRVEFRVFLEYEKTEAVDDIVVFEANGVRAIQARYAVDNLAVYAPADFTSPESRTYFGRFAKGWLRAREEYPTEALTVELMSNRGRDSQLEDIIGAEGKFTEPFIEGRMRKNAREFRGALRQACGFAGADADAQFHNFLTAFRFRLREPSLADLRQFIENELLDRSLGISDRSVFHQLKELVERHSIDVHDPITAATLDEIFRAAQRRFLVPQVFPVNKQTFIRVTGFRTALRSEIDSTHGGYIVVTGLPGSGKSTSLSEFFDNLGGEPQFAVCRYFCFVDPQDDMARLRIEAEALRVNLISELHRLFPDILERRFDYSERNFADVLSLLGKQLTEQGKKLVILLDGLDHAERDQTVTNSVLRALPTALSDGVVIVVGTQELKHWEPLALREGRQHRHITIPLFTRAETESYLVEKNRLSVEPVWVTKIHEKSQGLPLYLRYVVTWLSEHDNNVNTLSGMPEAVGGDIRDYYERLWINLERENMMHARHLCGVLAALRFPVTAEEIGEFQSVLSVAEIPKALQAVTHLLRERNANISVFHDSFRIFVSQKLDGASRTKIARDILQKLKAERGSGRWFGYAFSYALDADDSDYVLAQVNRSFVDFALQHCRPGDEILNAIQAAGAAATRRKDLVQLSRLGSLYFRSRERLEQFDYGTLARVQLALGRVEDVLGFCFRPSQRRWLVNDAIALEVMQWCAETNHRELGQRLFDIFVETHDGTVLDERHEVEAFAANAAIYLKPRARFLRWLSQFTFQPDTLERRDGFAPGFAPHLGAYVRSCFRYGPEGAWRRLKRIKRLFPNHLIRHLLLRLVADHGSSDELVAELNDYLANTSTKQNVEVAGYAVFAGLPLERVKDLAGPISLPPRNHEHGRMTLESDFDGFKWAAIVLGYEGDNASIMRVADHIGTSQTMYSGLLRFLLCTGVCLGRAAAGRSEDAYGDAILALRALAEAGKEDEPDEMDTLRACRPMLPRLLGWLTSHVAHCCESRLDEWRNELLALRETEMWTSHWGITESRVDYSFELQIWDRLTSKRGMRSRLLPILHDCGSTYAEATALKAGERSYHFFWLAAIAARCDWRTDAEQWREKGAACSLTYGYHKDTTLDNLINVLEQLNPHERELGISRCAAILELAKWMRAVTDNRMTKDFEQSVFRVLLQTSREASFALIRFFREHTGRWKMLDCLEQYCTTATSGNPNVLWVLKDAFSAHYVERGYNAKQLWRVATSLKNLALRLDESHSAEWNARYSSIIRTQIDPLWWPDHIRQEIQEQEGWQPPLPTDPNQASRFPPRNEFAIRGAMLARADIEARLAESIDRFIETAEALRSSTEPFSDNELIRRGFDVHVQRVNRVSDAKRLWDFARQSNELANAETLYLLSNRLLDFEETDASFECLLAAYQRASDYWSRQPQGQSFLAELCARDINRVRDFFVEHSQSAFRTEYGGFDLPQTIGSFFSASGQIALLRQVFEDYLQHCQELFAHLPPSELYGWLRDYREDGRDESTEVVNFLIDLLGESEIDQGDRLLHVLADLAKKEPSLVSHACCERLSTAEPLLLDRLETLIDALAAISPVALANDAALLTPLLSQLNFRRRMIMTEVVRRVSASAEVPARVLSAAAAAERAYTPIITYPSRRFVLAEPSDEFVRFIQRGALFDFRDRVRGVCDVLNLHPAIVLSDIERALLSSGWTEMKEQERLKEDWEHHAHDRKVVWIVPRFHIRVSELLQEFVHRAVENGRYDRDTVRALTNVLRLGDPEWIRELPRPKPADIHMINVTDGPSWVNGLNQTAALEAQTLQQTGRITVYEHNRFSQTDGWHPKFVSTVTVQSLLVSPATATQSHSWPAIRTWTQQMPCRSADENLTTANAGELILAGVGSTMPNASEIAPLVARHVNGTMFNGMRLMLSVYPAWLPQGCTVEGLEVRHEGRAIARVEQWQQGYEDEAYSRELLSVGIRLTVQNDWLRSVMHETQRALAIAKLEEREFREHFWDQTPTSKADCTSYSVFIE